MVWYQTPNMIFCQSAVAKNQFVEYSTVARVSGLWSWATSLFSNLSIIILPSQYQLDVTQVREADSRKKASRTWLPSHPCTAESLRVTSLGITRFDWQDTSWLVRAPAEGCHRCKDRETWVLRYRGIYSCLRTRLLYSLYYSDCGVIRFGQWSEGSLFCGSGLL